MNEPGVISTGMTMPYTTPYSLNATEEENPAAISRMGNTTEISEFMSEEEVRIAVTGREDFKRGRNSFLGERSLPPLMMKYTTAMTKEQR